MSTRATGIDNASSLTHHTDRPPLSRRSTDFDAEEEPAEAFEFPEGGMTAWLVVFGCWCGMISTFGISNSIGTIQYELSRNQLKNYSDSDISWIFSIWLWLCFSCSAQVGPIFDAYGVLPLLIPGSIVMAVSFILLSVCTKYWHFILAFSIPGGIASSMVFTPCITSVGHWFKERRAVATGIAASGGAFGGILFPLTINKMVGTSLGFAWAIRITAFEICFLLLLCVIFTKDRHKEQAKFTSRAVVSFHMFKEVRYCCCVLAIFLCEWAIFVPLNYLVTYAVANGMGQDYGNQLLAYFNVASVLGRALPGWVADRIGSFKVMTICTVMSSLACLCIWIPVGHTKAGLTAFTVVFGFFSGSTISLTPVCVSRISSTYEYGKRYGTCYTISSFAALTGLPISGRLQGHNYLGMMIFCGVCYGVGAIMFQVSRWVGNARWF